MTKTDGTVARSEAAAERVEQQIRAERRAAGVSSWCPYTPAELERILDAAEDNERSG